MKKLQLAFILITLTFAGTSQAQLQVFNSASTLKKGQFSIGVNPYFSNDLGLLLHGGIGLKKGVDMAIQAGFTESGNYFGADLEWLIASGKPNISLLTGGHISGDFGLDAGLNISFPIKGDTEIYTGIDADINFTDNITMPVFIPIGIELALQRRLSMILEGDIALNDADNMFGGGIVVYF